MAPTADQRLPSTVNRLRPRSIGHRPLTETERLNTTLARQILSHTRRPKIWGDCQPGGRNEARPCPFVGCRYNLFLDVIQRSGSIKLNHPHLPPNELEETCALDVADLGGRTLEQVGRLMNLTVEGVRLIEIEAAGHLREELTRR